MRGTETETEPANGIIYLTRRRLRLVKGGKRLVAGGPVRASQSKCR